MATAITFTDVESFKDYVETFYDKLLSKLFYGFPSAQLFMGHEGVKGKEVLTQLVVNALVQRYNATWNPQNAADLQPRVLEVAPQKVDLEFVPKAWESSYVGRYRKMGQDSMDLPFQGFIMEQILQDVASKIENAIWNAEAVAVPASGDPIEDTFDGIVRIISDAVLAADLSAYTTGALTNSNINGHLEGMYDSLGAAYKYREMDAFISLKDRTKLIQNRRDDYGKYVGDTNSIQFDIGNLTVHALPSIPENFVLMTPKENIHYGYDSPGDSEFLNFEQRDRTLKVWMDFLVGVQVGIIDSDLVVVNDHALLVA